MTPRGFMPPPPNGRITTADIKQYKDAQPWVYYDTRVFSANIVTPDTVAVNFAQATSPIGFFNARNIGNGGLGLTNMSDNNKTDNDFICDIITVDVVCSIDALSTPGICTSETFVELITHETIMTISFGTDVRFIAPTMKMPAGGGMVSANKIRTQAMAAFSDSAQASNGQQTRAAVMMLREPILFKEGTAFTTTLTFSTPAALARLQGLQPLIGNFEALIRINLEGVRGKGLLKSTPSYA